QAKHLGVDPTGPLGSLRHSRVGVQKVHRPQHQSTLWITRRTPPSQESRSYYVTQVPKPHLRGEGTWKDVSVIKWLLTNSMGFLILQDKLARIVETGLLPVLVHHVLQQVVGQNHDASLMMFYCPEYIYIITTTKKSAAASNHAHPNVYLFALFFFAIAIMAQKTY
ncbi:unnamed protein product, partial [Heterosigma akashiwo]